MFAVSTPHDLERELVATLLFVHAGRPIPVRRITDEMPFEVKGR